MLKTIDRIQFATDDAERTASGWVEFLGAELEGKDSISALGAKRTTYRLGRGAVEFLEPDGAGAIQDAMKTRKRPHLFAGGVSSEDFEGTVARLRSKGIDPALENGQAFFNAKDCIGVDAHLVLSPYEDAPSVGDIDYLYEVTLLTREADKVGARFADLFGLDSSVFVPIDSPEFGYTGVLTLFDDDELHRFEIITPLDDTKTMGRFFKAVGPSYYMAFAETPEVNRVEKKVLAADAGITVNRPESRGAEQIADEMWIHPRALGGMMLGVSRPSMAWRWSGHPDRVLEVV